MKNIGIKLIVIAVIILMLIPIISDIVASNVLKKISASEFDKFVSDTSNYKLGVLYIGEDNKDVKKTIDATIKEYKDNKSEIEVSGYFMDASKLSEADAVRVVGISGVRTAYIFAVNGEVLKIEPQAITDAKLTSYVKEFTSSGIDEELKHYKVVDTADGYKKLVKDKKTITMAVFGKDSCAWCNLFKPVYNIVAEEYNLDIYYFDSDSYDKEEYKKIMDLGLTLPASCNNGKEKALADGFGTPLTVFTKNGKVIDCISSGYMNKSALITKLKTVGMINE